MTLREVNESDRLRFVEKVGWVFEHSPWVAERAWIEKPFASLDDLHRVRGGDDVAGQEPEHVAAAPAKPSGHVVGTEPEVSGGFEHPRARLVGDGDVVDSVEDERNGRSGHAGEVRHVLLQGPSGCRSGHHNFLTASVDTCY